MKPIFKVIVCAAMAAICIVSQTGCAGKEPVSGDDFLLNTACNIKLYESPGSKSEQEALIRDTFALCRDYENRLSRTIKSSDIGRLNDAGGEPVEVDPTTVEVVNAGLDYAERTEGVFDITVGELSELWNFSGDDPHVPDAAAIAEAVTHVDYRKVEILNDTASPEIRLTDPQTKLDLGAIAKGYIADKAAEFLREKGVTSAVLNFGGNVVCIGEKPEGTPFVIGVEKPFSAEGGKEKEMLGTLDVADKAVVTSGTYERKFYENGILYYHILDTKTGYPKETDLDGVSIIGPNSTDCDGLSTTCLMLGLEKGKALIDSLPDFEAVFVTKDGRVEATDGLRLNPVS